MVQTCDLGEYPSGRQTRSGAFVECGASGLLVSIRSDVSDHHTHTLLSVELGRGQIEWLCERTRNSEQRLDGPQAFTRIQEWGISDWLAVS